jgi:hypothetical protein
LAASIWRTSLRRNRIIEQALRDRMSIPVCTTISTALRYLCGGCLINACHLTSRDLKR